MDEHTCATEPNVLCGPCSLSWTASDNDTPAKRDREESRDAARGLPGPYTAHEALLDDYELRGGP